MVDYLLTDGKATTVRQEDSAETGHVDVDMEQAGGAISSTEDTDRLLIQRGFNDPQTVTVAQLRAGLQATLTDVDWLNNGYLY